jgi:hypothetical protein
MMTSGVVWTEGISLPLDFAVCVLRHDGLRLAPFESHPDGDGWLRAAGMDSASWREWVEVLVRREKELGAAGANLTIPSEAVAASQFAAQIRRTREQPWTGFPKGRGIRDRLADMWVGYVDDALRWSDSLTSERQHDRLTVTRERSLRAALERVQGLPPFSVFRVRYQAPAVLVVPPDVCIVGLPDDPDQGRGFAEQVEAGALKLVAARTDHRTGSG